MSRLLRICLKIKFPEIEFLYPNSPEFPPNREPFKYKDQKYYINYKEKKITSDPIYWAIKFGETDIDKIIQRIKKLEQEYLESTKQFNEFINTPESELKKFAIENIDKWDGEFL